MGSAWRGGGRTVFGKMAGTGTQVPSDVDEQFECWLVPKRISSFCVDSHIHGDCGNAYIRPLGIGQGSEWSDRSSLHGRTSWLV